MSEITENLVFFECVKEKASRLRIRIVSPGYNPEANCQFPRNIRREGAKYSAPSSCIRFARGSAGKFFYRVSKTGIKVLTDEVMIQQKVSLSHVYEEECKDCVVCFDNEHDVVIVPCGHYCLCHSCAKEIEKSTKKCPMCRGRMDLIVTRDMIQT